ncbi:MAG TPA: glycerol-3-phosphate 1-O-acyltransferase PlsY [Candidatus Eisenbacteria bacterium]
MAGALALAAVLAIGYLCGSLPWGLWLGRWLRGVDVRTLGSGNLGATNVYRSLGPAIGIATLGLDIAKGALPVWLLPLSPLGALVPGGGEWCALAAGLAAIAGHMWTVFARFRGGKGVATTVGVLLALSPPAVGVFAAVFVVAVAATRYVSLGSILGAVGFAVTLAITGRGWRSPTALFGALVALLVIVRHRDNIARLARGAEHRFSFRPAGTERRS